MLYKIRYIKRFGILLKCNDFLKSSVVKKQLISEIVKYNEKQMLAMKSTSVGNITLFFKINLP